MRLTCVITLDILNRLGMFAWLRGMMGYEADSWGSLHLEPTSNIAGLTLRSTWSSKCTTFSIPQRFGEFSRLPSPCPAHFHHMHINHMYVVLIYSSFTALMNSQVKSKVVKT
jgi:hypothetical protein